MPRADQRVSERERTAGLQPVEEMPPLGRAVKCGKCGAGLGGERGRRARRRPQRGACGSLDTSGCLEKDDFVQKVLESQRAAA